MPGRGVQLAGSRGADLRPVADGGTQAAVRRPAAEEPTERRRGRGGVERIRTRMPSGCCAASCSAAYRRPVAEARGGSVSWRSSTGAMATGNSFHRRDDRRVHGGALLARFVCLEEKPGPLDDYALASRLSFFLWNSEPDDDAARAGGAGRAAQAGGAAGADGPDARRPEVAAVRGRVPRLLARPAEDRRTSPDATLYPDYYLDDLLVESAVEETQLFFAELLRGDSAGAECRRRRTSRCSTSGWPTHYGLAGRGGRGDAAGAAAGGQRRAAGC